MYTVCAFPKALQEGEIIDMHGRKFNKIEAMTLSAVTLHHLDGLKVALTIHHTTLLK